MDVPRQVRPQHILVPLHAVTEGNNVCHYSTRLSTSLRPHRQGIGVYSPKSFVSILFMRALEPGRRPPPREYD